MQITAEDIKHELEHYNENIWEIKKQRTKSYIERFKKKITRTLICNDKVYALHCLLGDQHLGNDGTDMEKMEYDAISIGNCEYARAYNIGDTTDNFIKLKIVEAMTNKNSNAKQELKLVEKYLTFFNGHLVLFISGNHEDWAKEMTGIDWLSQFYKQRKILYSRNQFRIIFKHCGIEYYFLFRHKYKYKSYMNPTHSPKQMMRNLDMYCDVYAKAHDHISAIEQSTWSDIDRLFISCGSYKIADNYGLKEGFPEAKSIMPCFVTSPFEKKITAFYYLEDGIKYVNLMNKELLNG